MTRKDFELIATVIRDLQNMEGVQKAGAVTLTDLADRFAGALTATNPRFDRVRFINAATGLTSSSRSAD